MRQGQDLGPPPWSGSDSCQGCLPRRAIKVNREYAERVGDAWLVLSAKFGLLRPAERIDGPYDATFNRRCAKPIEAQAVREQVLSLDLDGFERVIGLGGIEYRRVLKEAFAGLVPRLDFPFKGTKLGEALRATKLATEQASQGVALECVLGSLQQVAPMGVCREKLRVGPLEVLSRIQFSQIAEEA